MLEVSDNVMTVDAFNDILNVIGRDYVIKTFKAYEFIDADGVRKIRIDDLKYVAKYI